MASTIRLARPMDQAAIEAIVEAAYRVYVPRMGMKPMPMLDDYEVRIAAGQAHVLDEDGAVLGLVVLVPEDGVMLLDNVAVDPARQGRGLGHRLLAFAEGQAREAGLPAIRLLTNATMVENIARYGRLGYVETGRLEREGRRAVMMRKSLVEPA